MGSSSNSKFYSWEQHAIMAGLDSVGKRSILEKLNLPFETKIPTIGFIYDEVHHGKFHLRTWFVGGSGDFFKFYKPYFATTTMVIFVVDSNDTARMLKARDELHRIVNDELLQHVPVLVFANKQDLPNALDCKAITEALELHKLPQQKWHIQACSVSNGTGIQEGFEWFMHL